MMLPETNILSVSQLRAALSTGEGWAPSREWLKKHGPAPMPFPGRIRYRREDVLLWWAKIGEGQCSTNAEISGGSSSDTTANQSELRRVKEQGKKRQRKRAKSKRRTKRTPALKVVKAS